MANKIQIKRSNVANRVPGAGGIAAIVSGELAINFADNRLYYGNNSGNTTDIMTVIHGVTNAQLAGSISDGKLNKITAPNKIEIQSLDIDNAQDIGAGLVATDTIIVDDGAAGTNRKSAISRLATLMGGSGLGVSGATLSVGVDDSTIEINSDALRVKAGGVDSNQIAGDAIDGTKIADNAVDSEHIAAGALDTEHFGIQQIVAGNLQSSSSSSTGAVTTDKIRPGAVTTAKIAANAITADLIGDDVINSEHYAHGSIDTIHIGDNQVDGDKLADSITVAADLTVNGNLVVEGATTTLNVATLEVEDTFIELNKAADGNASIEDTRDVGIYTSYDTDSNSAIDEFRYTGLFRDASKDKWIFFGGLGTEPSATPGAITAGANVGSTAKLQANLEGVSSSALNTITNYAIDCGTF